MNLEKQSKKIISLIKINKLNILITLLIIYASYCAIVVGQSWDEEHHLLQGKITLNYLFSLGSINVDLFYREFYSPSYWTIQFFLTQIFPIKYQIEIAHLINLIFSLSTIIAFGKFGEELFNKKIGIYFSILLAINPIFFGHMIMNGKDTIIAFSHMWIICLFIKYLKKQKKDSENIKYIFFISLLIALGTGVQLLFIGTLIPIIIFMLLDIFIFKKITNKNFSIVKFFKHLVYIFLITYFILIVFWIDTHQNILILPFKFFFESLSPDIWRGWPYNLVDGNYSLSSETKINYLIVNLIYKLPEFIIFTYIIFIIFFFKINKYLKNNIYQFNAKLIFIISIILFPTFILYIIPFPVYDGLRLFIWFIPYVCIIPAFVIYFLINNINPLKNKFSSLILTFLIIFYLVNFFGYTPYQYTYLNIFNGKSDKKSSKFENDYWGVSIKELVEKITLDKKSNIKLATCGINQKVLEKYLYLTGYIDINFVPLDKAEYVIMTNRVVLDQKSSGTMKINSCFKLISGKDITKVSRMGVDLSILRKTKI